MNPRALLTLACGLSFASPWALAQAPAATATPTTCQARSGEQQAMLVELYTSEGCNSCPPADRWLSTLKGRPGVLAAAFHVDYWDRLGWADRFASPAHSQRQAALQRSSGAGFSYTPQVLVNGRDWRGAPTLPLMGARAPVQVVLQRLDAQRVQVSVSALPGAPTRLGLWWALLEDGHRSAVAAGENRGETLQHDHVVRQYQPVPAWAPVPQVPTLITLVAPQNGEGGHKARLLVVVTDATRDASRDATTGAPLQALQLSC